MFDLAIVGGGPAGAAAAVYAARKHLKSILVTESFGGQSTESADVQNWIGTKHISGAELARALEEHAREYAGEFLDIRPRVRVSKVEKRDEGFVLFDATGKEVGTSHAVLIATGGTRRTLDVPGATEFENKGLTYCASCDGPLFSGQDTVVVGGGNAGFETAAQLLAYARSVTLVHRGADFSKADARTVETVCAHENMTALLNTEPVEVKGGAFVEGVVVKDKTTGKTRTIPAAGVFVEIGMIPSTELVKGVVELDAIGRIKVDCRNQRASIPGVWAAGDCTDGLYHQNNIAAGDAVKALEDIYFFLRAAK
ncbi:hypothetical protein COU20_01250 [Candidatus Kaiserbacteria bacterium CG10_big_fil_rev_8_21_14_0_10_59_10]|uniref:FAD/NAD(P)-binding domain-containing protein n=1 Tax=Candidatus Kaiserbacteria bacterium CG10_big_fil_rev_8_21_14_0_10_59_10 TaxID=1974612 RepID=A0A2H0U8C2_9BACT|nr:MAG: hypothetical protein COU20_01250 [Candidatus Kaiserbacteria bacterium CG10_big_fil_rev_8_21_14_0_10_59_10]